jgi:hypothetical protein
LWGWYRFILGGGAGLGCHQGLTVGWRGLCLRLPEVLRSLTTQVRGTVTDDEMKNGF